MLTLGDKKIVTAPLILVPISTTRDQERGDSLFTNVPLLLVLSSTISDKERGDSTIFQVSPLF